MEEALMIDYRKFKSTSEFFYASRSEGIQFPVTMMSMIERAMKELDLDFADTFDVLLKSGAIIPCGDYAFIYSVKGSATDPRDRFRNKRHNARRKPE
jgi:hypothetical protein